MDEIPLESQTLTSTDQDRSLRVPSLVVTVKDPKGVVVEAPLELAPLVIGTGAGCDVVVSDARVSRRHCSLELTARGLVLRDLGSKNGTLIGKVAIQEAVVPRSVCVTLGGSELVVRVAGAPRLVPMSVAQTFGEAIGQSYVMRALFARLEVAALSEQTILLRGESGTGKELLARAIHQHSPRREGPFVVLDCGAISANLLEAEVFGYTRGAFTGAFGARAGLIEEASGGTLFIDEVGELPLDLQPKLLRALEGKQVRRLGSNEWKQIDVRVVAATHRDLRARVAEGTFREDLYYRLAVLEARVPALRERKEDIPALVARLLSAHTPPRALADLPPHALSLLSAHDWPGNVRELRNVVARLVLFPDVLDELVPRPEAPAPDRAPAGPQPDAADAARLGPLASLPLHEAREMVMDRFERAYITVKLQEHGGNITRAADAMGVSRQLVYRMLERYGIRTK